MTTAAQQRVSTQQGEKTFLGQPRALGNLFGVEMWERFSFYGMQGILLIYLYYSATAVVSVSIGRCRRHRRRVRRRLYLATILGAWLSDRLLGAERTLFYSAVVVMCGHISLALLPGLAGVGVGLILVALGSGGVKANATALVGSLYDERRRTP